MEMRGHGTISAINAYLELICARVRQHRNVIILSFKQEY